MATARLSDAPQGADPAASPVIAVVVPLMDERGSAAEHLRTWTREQTLARECFQVVVASSGEDPEAEQEVTKLLGPGDVLARVPNVRGIALWNAAVQHAQAPWCLLTEAHCLAGPGCLEAIARTVEAEPWLDAVTCEHGHVVRSSTGTLLARWFDQVYRRWSEPGQWRRLNLVGVAIKCSSFQAAGGLDPHYGMFATFHFAARLDAAGARIGHAPDALIRHVHNETFAEHRAFTMDHARGECEARQRHDVSFAERYFGHESIWANRLRYRSDVARPAAQAVASGALYAARNCRTELPWMTRELGLRLATATAGVLPFATAARARLAWNTFAAERLPASENWRYARFLRAHEAAVTLSRLEWVSEQIETSSARVLGVGDHLSAQEVTGTVIVGTHGLERWEERWFRWSEPVAVLRVSLPEHGATLRFDTGGLRGAPLDYLAAVYADGRRVRGSFLAGDNEHLDVHLPPSVPTREIAVVVLCSPLRPSGRRASDRRRLGMPIVSVELAQAP